MTTYMFDASFSSLPCAVETDAGTMTGLEDVLAYYVRCHYGYWNTIDNFVKDVDGWAEASDLNLHLRAAVDDDGDWSFSRF